MRRWTVSIFTYAVFFFSCVSLFPFCFKMDAIQFVSRVFFVVALYRIVILFEYMNKIKCCNEISVVFVFLVNHRLGHLQARCHKFHIMRSYILAFPRLFSASWVLFFIFNVKTINFSRFNHKTTTTTIFNFAEQAICIIRYRRVRKRTRTHTHTHPLAYTQYIDTMFY